MVDWSDLRSAPHIQAIGERTLMDLPLVLQVRQPVFLEVARHDHSDSGPLRHPFRISRVVDPTCNHKQSAAKIAPKLPQATGGLLVFTPL